MRQAGRVEAHLDVLRLVVVGRDPGSEHRQEEEHTEDDGADERRRPLFEAAPVEAPRLGAIHRRLRAKAAEGLFFGDDRVGHDLVLTPLQERGPRAPPSPRAIRRFSGRLAMIVRLRHCV